MSTTAVEQVTAKRGSLEEQRLLPFTVSEGQEFESG